MNELPYVSEYIHSQSKKIYITLNTLIKEVEFKKVFNLLSYLENIKVDGIIVQDFSIIKFISQYFPNINIHASTQMSNLNSYDLKFLEKFNVKRVVVDRHLTLEEIALIIKNSNIEVEMFVHGAMCFSIAGQCIFSSYLGGQSGNRGRCTQPCRRDYILNKEGKGFYFSPNDISCITILDKIIKMGVSALKIEGRMKSAEYVGNVVRAYRIVIDEYKKNNVLDKKVLLEAKKIILYSFGRKTTTGCYVKPLPVIVEPKLTGGNGIFVGIAKEKSDKFLKIRLLSDVFVGDRIRIESSKNNEMRFSFKITKLFDLSKRNLKSAKKNQLVLIPLKENINVLKGDVVLKISSKERFFKFKNEQEVKRIILSKKVKKVKYEEKDFKYNFDFNDSNLNSYINYFKFNNINALWSLPDNFKDKIIIPIEKIENNRKINIFKNNIFLELSPFIFEFQLKEYSNFIKKLIDMGFKNFFLNSKSHRIFFEKYLEKVELIASERFHVLNSITGQFLIDNNIKNFVLDIENSKENLENFQIKNNAIILLYSDYPLLVSRIPVKQLRRKSLLKDNRGHKFVYKKSKELGYIYSEMRFNITPFRKTLEQLGYKQFLYDLSNFSSKKMNIKKFIFDIKSGKYSSGSTFNFEIVLP